MSPTDRWNDDRLDALSKDVGRAQDELTILRALPAETARVSVKADALAEQLSDLKEVLSELREEINTRFDRVDGSTDKISSFKTAMQFASIIIVPVLLALIGGYFALKGAQVSAISH